MEQEEKSQTFTQELIVIVLFSVGVSVFVGPWFLIFGIFLISARLYEHRKK